MATTTQTVVQSRDVSTSNVFSGTFTLNKAQADFIVDDSAADPHQERRKQILKKHPEIKKLYGHDPLSKWITIACVAAQLSAACCISSQAGSFAFWVLAYVFGATVTQTIFLANHEASHNLFFREPWKNMLFTCIVGNAALPLPYTSSFKSFHTDHHKEQGSWMRDSDIPTRFEAKLLSSRPGKLFFCTFMVGFYILRPLAFKQPPITKYTLVNMTAVAITQWLLYTLAGPGANLYLVASSWLAGSLHPCAAHFVTEHYVFVDNHETYSYYGPLNWITFNVGYHQEHHDFPFVSWRKLPEVKRIAPEFYDHLPYHKSWSYALYRFITDANRTLNDRVIRNT